MGNVTSCFDDLPRCTQCGICCKNEVCEIGKMIFNTETLPCPGLIYENGKHWCGPVMGEIIYPGFSKMFKLALGIGKGCDSEIIERKEYGMGNQ